MLNLCNILVFLNHFASILFNDLHALNQLVRYYIFLHCIDYRPLDLAGYIYKLSISLASRCTAPNELTANAAADTKGMESLRALAAFDEVNDLLGVANGTVGQEVDMAGQDVVLGGADDGLEGPEDLGTTEVR